MIDCASTSHLHPARFNHFFDSIPSAAPPPSSAWPEWFETDGQRRNGTVCEYTFHGGPDGRTSGKFFSPQYPSSYPKNSRCKYTFVGQPDQRIKLVFDYVNLQKNDVR